MNRDVPSRLLVDVIKAIPEKSECPDPTAALLLIEESSRRALALALSGDDAGCRRELVRLAGAAIAGANP